MTTYHKVPRKRGCKNTPIPLNMKHLNDFLLKVVEKCANSIRILNFANMAGINKVIIVGNLGKDPETRYTTNNIAVSSLSVATSETYNDWPHTANMHDESKRKKKKCKRKHHQKITRQIVQIYATS